MFDRTLTLGHSPDPDDAFMFYALAENKIDTKGWRFRHVLQDIEMLNERATRGELHISAISIHAYAYVLEKYALLSCGASMGDGYGPILIARPNLAGPFPADDSKASAAVEADRTGGFKDWLRTQRIVVPGTMTSAFLALQLYLGKFASVVAPFDGIFDVLSNRQADLGLIIHEGQLTYGAKGFQKVLDLGEWWKSETGLPLPLGGNVIRKDLPAPARSEINAILRESIRYGLKHRSAGVAHAMPLARGMDVQLADRFIGMYVNEYTLDYGEVGRTAIRELLGRAERAGLIPPVPELEFVG